MLQIFAEANGTILKLSANEKMPFENEHVMCRIEASEVGAGRTELDVQNGVCGWREGAHVLQRLRFQHLDRAG